MSPFITRPVSFNNVSVPYAPYSRASNGSLAVRRCGTGSRVRGGKVAISAILTCLPENPGTPCAYRIARSRRSAVPYTAWTKCRQRGGQLQGIGGSLLRSPCRAVSPNPYTV